MTRIELRARGLPAALGAALALGLAGCGGGGGGGGSPPPSPLTLVIDVGNSDTVAHSTAAGVLAISPGQMLSMSGPVAAPTGARRAQAVGWLARVVAAAGLQGRSQALAVTTARPRPLAATGPITEPCLVSGTVSVDFDDRDNDGLPSAGDVMTIAYEACVDSPGETMGGVMATTFSDIGSSSLSARVTMTDLSDSTATHATRTTGSAQLFYQMLSGSQDITRLTADGPMVATVSTHLPFSDKLTLRSGFVQEVTYDAVIGVSTVSASGTIDSTAAGGSFEVATRPAALIKIDDSAAYPKAGQVESRGLSGTLVMTVQTGEKVRLDLDANDDGVAESSRTVEWDWLF